MRNFLLFLCLFAFSGLWAQPTTNAPTPPARNASDVISIYGDAYTNIGMVNYNPDWGQSGTVNIDFDPGTGDKVMAYTNFNYQGTGFEANPQNASAMEFVHIDIWTNNATNVKFSPIDNSGMGAAEFLVEVPVTMGEWSSVDLPKSAFTDMSWNSIFQLKFDGQGGTTPSDIYLDNIYFYKSGTPAGSDATLSVLQVNGANVPGFAASAFEYNYGVPGGGSVPEITTATTSDPNATVTAINQATAIPGQATVNVTAANGTNMATYTINYFYNSPAVGAPDPKETSVISLFSDAYTNVNVDFWNTSWSQAVYELDTIAGNPTHKYTNVGFNGIETTTNPINASQMKYLHMDVWTPNVTKLNMKLVSFLGDGFGGANGDSEANLDVDLTLSEWNQVVIALEDFTAAGLTSLDDLNQYIFTSTPFGPGILFIDNIYFSDGTTNVKEVAQNIIEVYPNPTNGQQALTVKADVNSMEFFDIHGRLILATDSNELNLNGVSSGFYLLKIFSKNHGTEVHRIIVE